MGGIAAFQKFRAANLINLPVMALYYLGPLAVLQVWNSLVAAMLVLVGCRVLMTAAYAVLCLRAMPSLRVAAVDCGALRPLLQLGSWMTLASLLIARLYPPAASAVRQMAPVILAAAVLLGSSLLADAVGWRLILVGMSGVCLLLVIWRASLSPFERALLLSRVGHVPLLAQVLTVIPR